MTAPVPDAERWTDESRDGMLPLFGDFIAALADIDDPEGDENDPFESARADIVAIERLTLALSVEVEIAPDGSGGVVVRGSTPTQYTETTVMPLFHRLALHVGIDPEHEPDGEG